MSEYNLLVSFPDGSPSFVNGFEAGEIWRDMQSGLKIERTVHSENRLVIERMSTSTGYDVEFKPTEYPEWLNCTGIKKRQAPERANPYGLKIIASTPPTTKG